MPSESKVSKEFFMFSRIWKLSVALLFAAALAGCSSANSTCSQEVATHPGMTCFDLGIGWYHAEFASQADQRPDHVGSALATPVSSGLISQ